MYIYSCEKAEMDIAIAKGRKLWTPADGVKLKIWMGAKWELAVSVFAGAESGHLSEILQSTP